MAYIRSTLHEILDFQKLHKTINCRMRNIVRSWHQAMLDATYDDFKYEAWFSHWTRYGLSTYLDAYIRVTLHKILKFYMLNCVTAWHEAVACHRALHDREAVSQFLMSHTLLQLSQTNKEFLAHCSMIDCGDSVDDAPCVKWQQICSIWDSANRNQGIKIP